MSHEPNDTAGIGENSAEIRRRIGEACGWLGVEIDGPANAKGGPRISSDRSRCSASPAAARN